MTGAGESAIREADTIAWIERELTVLLRRAELAVAKKPMTDRLVRSGYLLLSALEQDGPLGIAALADATRVDISTASRQVAPLERQHLVRRLSDPADGRASLVEITKRGLERLQATRDERHAVFVELLREWPERECVEFAGYLTRLNQAIIDRG